MKKYFKGTMFLVMAIFMLATASVNVFASYDPATKGDMLTYRNFFGKLREPEMVNGVEITAEEYPIPVYVNEGARPEFYHSEANWNGAIFKFENADITKDSNQIAIFYDFDRYNGLVLSADYYVYVSPVGTAQETAMTDSYLAAVLSYNKEDQEYEDVSTASWNDFYSDTNYGPMIETTNIKAGVYDIWVLVDMPELEETFEDNTSNVSAKLAEINFYSNPDIIAATFTKEPTPAMTTGAPKTTVPQSQSLGNYAVSGESAPTDINNAGALVWTVVIVICAVVIVGIVILMIRNKKNK